MRIAIILCLSAVCAMGQTTKKPVAVKTAVVQPTLSESFSKAGLKALFAAQENSYKADDAFTDARVEMDATARPDEAVMLANLLSYQIDHRTSLLKRETLKSELTADLCAKSGDQCTNPVFIENNLQANAKYKELMGKDSQCVAGLEKALRGKVSVEYSKVCP